MSNQEINNELIFAPENEINDANDTVQDAQTPSMFTWKGKRPFAGAVNYYVTNCLKPAIETAKENLV